MGVDLKLAVPHLSPWSLILVLTTQSGFVTRTLMTPEMVTWYNYPNEMVTWYPSEHLSLTLQSV